MIEISLSLAGILLLVLMTAGTAIAVAAEFSLTAVERGVVDAHVREVGDRRAHAVQRAHRTLSFQLSGAQVAITVTTVVTGLIAEPSLARLIAPALSAAGVPVTVGKPITVVLALVIATVLSMVFGELVPKNLAIARPLPTARAVAGVYGGFTSTFRWLINGMNSAANGIVRGFGVEPAEELRSARAPEELVAVVRASAEYGTLDAATANLLDRSLRFGERSAEDLMTPRVRMRALAADETVSDLLRRCRETGFSRFPVYGTDLDDIRGAVHVKQVFDVPVAEHARRRIGTLARPPLTVPASLNGDELLDRLRGPGLQLAIVVDEYGGTAGLVTLEDTVEEIVGEVRDEHDRGEIAAVRPLGENEWLVSGLLRDDEITDAIGLRLPPGRYETVAGFVLELLGRIPAARDEVSYEQPAGDGETRVGWLLRVTAMENHRVAEIHVRRTSVPLSQPENGSDR